MRFLLYSLMLALALTLGTGARAQLGNIEPGESLQPAPSQHRLSLFGARDAAGLPGPRPRLTMSLPLRADRLPA
ncbi:MAG: hypothetical protein ACOCVP_01885, partial [Wenzhouxiangella sp.]